MQAFDRERRIVLKAYGRIALPADAETTMRTYGPDMERAVDSILYIETDIPRGMTCNDWRRAKAPVSGRARLMARLRARRAAKSR
jgi:hypothetical protein